MISLIVSELNSVLPYDMDLLYNGKIKTFYMRFYPGHFLNDNAKNTMYRELSEIKNNIDASDTVLYARSYGNTLLSSETIKDIIY